MTVTTAPIGELVGGFIDRYRIVEGLNIMRAEDIGIPYEGVGFWSSDDQAWLTCSVEELCTAKEGQGVSDQDFFGLLHAAEAKYHLEVNPSITNLFDK